MHSAPPRSAFRRLSGKLVQLVLLLPWIGPSGGCGGKAQPATVKPLEPATTLPDDHGQKGPFLWEVQGKTGTSYLFGTVHMGVELTEMSPLVVDSLSRSTKFVMEMDISSVPRAQAAALSLLPAGESLAAMLGDADFMRLRKALPDQTPETLARLQPWAAFNLIIQRLHPTSTGLDQALAQVAGGTHKELMYLEDWQFQFKTLAEHIGVDDLRAMLDDSGSERKHLQRTLSTYRSGDFEAFTEVVLDPDEIARDPVAHAALFDDRNKAWMKTLLPELERGGAFVAVGAGHLAGPNGLIELVRSEGLVVQRVRPDAAEQKVASRVRGRTTPAMAATVATSSQR